MFPWPSSDRGQSEVNCERDVGDIVYANIVHLIHAEG